MQFKKKLGNLSLKNIIKYLWIAFLSGIGFFILLVLLIIIGVFGKLPSTEKLENPESPLATEIYSTDGVIIGKYFNENRSNVSYEEINPNMINALIATEDIRFKKHAGIDWWGNLAIPFYLLKGQKRGASTITQQLGKNLFPRTKFNNIFVIAIRKLKEWIISIQLERFYTKEEIITMYLNTVDFGSNAYGIKSASRTYFNVDPKDLKVEQAAVLVGLLKATYLYSPKFNPQKSFDRRNTVIRQMLKYDFITEQQFDSIVKRPTILDYSVESHNEGKARYFREFIRQELTQWCEDNGLDLYTSGLKIYTTIDSRMQQYAEEATYQHLTYLQDAFYKHWKTKVPWGNIDIITPSIKRTDRYRILSAGGLTYKQILTNFNKPVKMRIFAYKPRGEHDTMMSPLDSIKYYKYFLNPGFMVMDPSSGNIKAWVGGIDYKYFKYDHVNIASKRQVGSTFKPFVYTTAILNGVSPCLKVPNVPVIFPDFDNWQPKNNDGVYGDILTLEQGMARSVNCVTAYVIKQVGAEAVVALAHKMGIVSQVDPYPSICLGTADISVYEMVGAFNTYNNKGVWIEPSYMLRIEDKNGNILREYVPRKEEVMDEKYNYVMLNMLMKTSTIKNGTALRLRGSKYNFTNQVACKTGTTQNQSDGWFIGLIPQLTAGVWVGGEERSVHFRSTQLGQGANMALPIWALFVNKLYADPKSGISKNEKFVAPEEELPVEIDCSKYEDTSPEKNYDNIVE